LIDRHGTNLTLRFGSPLLGLIVPLSLVVSGFLVVPVLRLLIEGTVALVSNPDPLPAWVWPYLVDVTRNTLVLGGVTTALTIAAAVPLSFVIAKTDLPGTRAFLALMTIPMIAPPFIMAFSNQLLYGRSGFLNLTIEAVFGVSLPRIDGLAGLVITQLGVSIPYATLVLIAGLRGIPRHVEESAVSLGSSPLRTFLTVALPAVYPHVTIAALVVFLMSIGDVGGPLVIGGGYSVIASEIYTSVLSILTDDRIALILGAWAIVMSLVIMALVAALLRFTVKRYRPGHDPVVYHLGRGRIASSLIAWLLVLWLLLPFLTVIAQSFGTIRNLRLAPGGWTLSHYGSVVTQPQRMLDTLGLAVLATPIMVLVSLVMGHQIYMHRRFRFMNALMILPFLLPGVVLALGVLETWVGASAALGRSGAIPYFILLSATVIVRRLPYTLKTLEAGFLTIDRRQEEAATSLGHSRIDALFSVTLPQIRLFGVAACVIGLVKVVTELSASLVLAPPDWASLSLGVLYSMEQGQIGRASAMSVILVALVGTGTAIGTYLLAPRRDTTPTDDRYRSDSLEHLVLGRTPIYTTQWPRVRTGQPLRSWIERWEPLLIVDADQGIVDANRAFLRLVGAESVPELQSETSFSVLFFMDRTVLELFSSREPITGRATSLMDINSRRIPVILNAIVVTRSDNVRGYLYCRRVAGRSRRLAEYRRLIDKMAVAEQEVLKAQITPHFLFNTLNNVIEMIEHEPREAKEVVQNLADLYRYTLAATKRKRVTVSDEIAAVLRYLAVESARFGDRLEWDVRVAPPARNAWIPPMVLQPLVENAVNYGADDRGRVHIEVSVTIRGDDLQLRVGDRGTSQFDPAHLAAGTGTGLKNVEGRIFALYRRRLEFEQRSGGGVVVLITIPEGETR
jgi:iron(III) transport system permease protein